MSHRHTCISGVTVISLASLHPHRAHISRNWHALELVVLSDLPSVNDIETKYMRNGKKEIIHQRADNTLMLGIKYASP